MKVYHKPRMDKTADVLVKQFTRQKPQLPLQTGTGFSVSMWEKVDAKTLFVKLLDYSRGRKW